MGIANYPVIFNISPLNMMKISAIAFCVAAQRDAAQREPAAPQGGALGLFAAETVAPDLKEVESKRPFLPEDPSRFINKIQSFDPAIRPMDRPDGAIEEARAV